jgi:hypothetical protein
MCDWAVLNKSRKKTSCIWEWTLFPRNIPIPKSLGFNYDSVCDWAVFS